MSRRLGRGRIDPEDGATTVDMVTKYMGLPKAVDPASVYTNTFAGTEKLTPQEWAAVKARVRKFIRV